MGFLDDITLLLMDVFTKGGIFAWIVLIISFIYLIVRSKENNVVMLWLIPVTILILAVIFFTNWLGVKSDEMLVSGGPGKYFGVFFLHLLKIIITGLAYLYVVSVLYGLASIFSAIDIVKYIRMLQNGELKLFSDLHTIRFLLSILFLSGMLALFIRYGASNWLAYQPVKIKGSQIVSMKDMEFYKIPFRRILHSCVLTKPQKLPVGKRLIQFKPGFDYEKTSFYMNGNVRRGYLDESVTFILQNNKIELEQGEFAQFYEDGNPAEGILAETILWTPKNWETPLTLEQGNWVAFYRDGSLRKFPMNQNLTIKLGIGQVRVQKTDPWYSTEIYPNGKFKRFRVAAEIPFKVGDKIMTVQSGSEAELYEDGSFKSGFFTETTPIFLNDEPLPMQKETKLIFYPNGIIKGIINPYSTAYFHPDGSIFCEAQSGEEFIYKNETIFTSSQDDDTFLGFNDSDHKNVSFMGFHFMDCGYLLEKNRIELDPEYEENNLLICFDFNNYEAKEVDRIQFTEPVTFRFNGKPFSARPFEWVRLQ